MADSSAVHWYPSAAYLYVLHLDGPALAWEYLRRNPEYRRAWQRHRRHPQHEALRWGLRLLEDPARDARDAYPDWFPDPSSVVQVYPDAYPAADALLFQISVSYTHLRAHETVLDLVCRLLLEKKNTHNTYHRY